MATNVSLLEAASVSRTRAGFESFIVTLMLASQTKNVVVVEGPFDKEILSNFFDEHTTIIKPCDGIGYIKRVFDRLPPTYVNVIGIIDSDYSFGASGYSRVFCYDYNNIEMMIFHIDKLFDHLRLELNNALIEKEVLIAKRNEALSHLKPLSTFRLVCVKHFAGNNVIGKEDVYPDVASCSSLSVEDFKLAIINKINNSSKNGMNQLLKTLYISHFNNEYCNDYNLYDITSGHDFIDLFCAYLSINENNIRDALKSSFTMTLFKKTELFKKIKSYQTIQATRFLCA